MTLVPTRSGFSLFGGWTQISLPDGRVVWQQRLPRPSGRGPLGVNPMELAQLTEARKRPTAIPIIPPDDASSAQGNPYLNRQRRYDGARASADWEPYGPVAHPLRGLMSITALRTPFSGQVSTPLASAKATARPGAAFDRKLRVNARSSQGIYQGAGRNAAQRRPYLSRFHSEVLDLASRYQPEAGTNQWGMGDFVKWQLLGKDIHAFKAQWVHGYKDAIRAAAARFDLPPALLAGVVYNEVGGDPLILDNLAYMARSSDPRSPSFRDLTSFGNVSLEIARASKSLGYGASNDLTETQRRVLIRSLEDPVTNIFISAKHLADLRDIDFSGVPSSKLTDKEVEVIGARYNHGADVPLSSLQNDLSYGRAITKRWQLLNVLLAPHGPGR